MYADEYSLEERTGRKCRRPSMQSFTRLRKAIKKPIKYLKKHQERWERP
jgi:hypothetical protein